MAEVGRRDMAEVDAAACRRARVRPARAWPRSDAATWPRSTPRPADARAFGRLARPRSDAATWPRSDAATWPRSTPRPADARAFGVATYGVDTTPALSNGVPVTGLSGNSGSPTEEQFFKLTVPAGASRVVFSTSGAGNAGDADLFVKRGTEPSQLTFDCRSNGADSNESCTFNSPTAGAYFVMVRSAFSYSGVTLVGHFP